MNPTVLVTGGAGFVGSHACKALAMAGYLPVTYDNLSRGHRWAVQWGPLEEGELSDARRLDEVMRKYRPLAVLHFASLIEAGHSVVDPGAFYTNNVCNTLLLLHAMRRNGIDRFVFSSSAAVYGSPQSVPIREDHPQQPVNPYGSTKKFCETILADFATAYGLNSVSLRYFNAAGADPGGALGEAHEPETHLIPLVLQSALAGRPGVSVYGDDYPTHDGTCVRDFVHVSDLADAHRLALERTASTAGAHAYNLGTGHGHTVLEVINVARRVTGRDIVANIERRRAGDPACLVADPSAARKALGWSAVRSDIEVQITDAWNWYRRPKDGTAANRRADVSDIARTSCGQRASA